MLINKLLSIVVFVVLLLTGTSLLTGMTNPIPKGSGISAKPCLLKSKKSKDAVITYEYDDKNRLISETTTMSSPKVTMSYTYTYDANGRVTKFASKVGKMSISSDYVYTYNTDGVLISCAYNYLTSDVVCKYKYANGKCIEITTNTKDRKTPIISSNTRTLEYNKEGNVVKVTKIDSKPELNEVTTYTYDENSVDKNLIEPAASPRGEDVTFWSTKNASKVVTVDSEGATITSTSTVIKKKDANGNPIIIESKVEYRGIKKVSDGTFEFDCKTKAE